jgi:hypothetical protein
MNHDNKGCQERQWTRVGEGDTSLQEVVILLFKALHLVLISIGLYLACYWDVWFHVEHTTGVADAVCL